MNSSAQVQFIHACCVCLCACVALVTSCTFVHVNTQEKYKPRASKHSSLLETQGYVSLTCVIVLLINDVLWLMGVWNRAMEFCLTCWWTRSLIEAMLL